MNNQKFFVSANGSRAEVLEVYEGINNWYWFITEKSPDLYGEWFGLVVGFETEWGYIFYPELDQQIQKGTVWKVPKSNWFTISHISREIDLIKP